MNDVKFSNNINLEDFSKLFNVPINEFPECCIEYIQKNNFHYRIPTGKERESYLLNAIKRVDSGELTKSGHQKQAIWEKGWSENLQAFTSTGDIKELIPKFVRTDSPVRLSGKGYIIPQNSNFETAFVTVLRFLVFRKYLINVDSVFEFGCGTGLNLVALAKLYPKKKLHGLDWTQASVNILSSLNDEVCSIEGHLFDMFHPQKKELMVPLNSGFLTIGAMEQLGRDYGNFLEFMLSKRPSIVIHVETMYELYDDNQLFDYVAKRYVKARNWLYGYLKTLREYEENDMIELVDIRRPFGSFYHDGYSLVVWRPKYV